MMSEEENPKIRHELAEQWFETRSARGHGNLNDYCIIDFLAGFEKALEACLEILKRENAAAMELYKQNTSSLALGYAMGTSSAFQLIEKLKE